MTPLSLLNAFACVVFLALVVLVLRNNVHSLLNWSCALLLAAFMVWSLENAFHCNPRLSPARAELLGNIFSFGWVSWASLTLLFVLVFTRRRRFLHTWPVVLLMTGLPATLIVAQWAGHLTHANVQASFGWVRTWSNSIWSALFYVYYLSFAALAFYFLFRFRSEAKNLNERKQAGLIFVTGLIAMVLGSATDVVLPLAGARVPQLAAAFSLIWAGGLYYSVTRLGMMRITAKAAADEIIATMRDSLLLLSPEGMVVSTNQAALDLLEYSEAELVGKPAALLFTSPGLYEAALQQVRQEGELKYIELTCRTSQGKEIPASISARVMRQRRNAGTGIVWVLRDISGRQEHEAAMRRAYNELEQMVRERTAELTKANLALHSSEERFRILFEHAPDSYYVNDLSGTLLAGNRAAEQLTGYARSELIGGSFLKLGLLSAGQIPRAAMLLARNALHQPTGPDEFVLRRKDGTQTTVEILTHPVKLEGKSVVLGIARDITDRKRTEEELEAHRHRLEELVGERTRELTRAQAELVKREKQATLGQIAASMAHELRSPLGAMHNAVIYLNMAERQALSEKGLRHLAVIDSQIERSNRIITALLTFAESQPPMPRRVELPKIMESVLTGLSIPAGIAVVKEIPAGLPPMLADPEQVGVALRNIIENALLAMPGGGRLTLRAAERNGAGAQESQVALRRVQVAVQDTGCGIKPEHVPQLFEPLFSTRTVGAGLGLPIARKLIEANHGTIEVESGPGKGATFTVTLPAASSE